MGQIVSLAAKPKRCNLNQLSQVPTPAAGEYILVSSDNSMNAAGQGNFDCYVVGDGKKAATALELKNVETLIGVFDISSYHATGGVLAKYADLTAALNDGNNIPQSFRKGGMSVKFVQSSDNKYVQFRYMETDATTAATFTNVANWQGVDDEPTAGSENLVKSGGAYEVTSELREDVGNKQSTTTRHDIDITSGWNSGKAIVADDQNTNFGKSTSSSSYSSSVYFDISAYAGKILHYTRPKTTRASSAYGLVFFTGNDIESAISPGYLIGTNAAEMGYELVEVTIPDNAVYARFTMLTEFLEHFEAYVMVTEKGAYTDGLGKRVQDLEGQVTELDDEIENSVSELSNTIDTLENVTLNGLTTQEFLYSTVLDNGYGLLEVPISLSQLGDYVEFDATINNGSTYFLQQVASSNIPGVFIYKQAYLSIRLPGKTTQNYFAENIFTIGNRHKIKIILDSITNDTYSYKVYLDNAEISYSDLTCSTPFVLKSVGASVKTANGATWYSLKYKTAGIDYNIVGFENNLNNVENITDSYQSNEYDGLKGLNERVSSLENDNLIGKMFYKLNASNGGGHNAKGMYVYCQVKDNIYIRYRIGLYRPGTPDDKTIHNTYWRLQDSAFNVYENGAMTAISGAMLLTNGENEFVIRQTSPAKTDFTGGYHGDEYIYDDNGNLIEGAFAEFFADDEVVPLNADIELTPCERFYYKEYSPMYETANSNSDTTNVGRLIAWHTKQTLFTTDGYITENRIDLVENIPYYAFTGIVCVDRYVSQYAMGEQNILTDMGTGEPNIEEQFKNVGNSKIFYKGNGYTILVESHVEFGDDDGEQTVFVNNHTQYNKYYRKSQIITNGGKLKCITSVKIGVQHEITSI